MKDVIGVVLPPHCGHLASAVQGASGTPIVDATGAHAPDVPEGAWVRTRPGRPAPGEGPVILAELGAPVPGRETWLETSAPRAVPDGFAGLVLKGREAGGLCGQQEGLLALAACPEPERVLLDAGVGPVTAAAAAALGAAGVLLQEQLLGLPEIPLPERMRSQLQRARPDETTCVVAGWRIANPLTAQVLRRLNEGEEPWALVGDLWTSGDLDQCLWMAGQGIALARELAERHSSLEALLQAYRGHWSAGSSAQVRAVEGVAAARSVGCVEELADSGVAAGTDGLIGSAVLWQFASWLGQPITGGPDKAEAATGCPRVGEEHTGKQVEPEPPATETSRPPAAAAPTPAPTPTTPTTAEKPAIAIIGIGCHFPKAPAKDVFWSNIVGGVCAIHDDPGDRWNTDLYFDEDRSTPDRTYTTIGGFIDDFTFNSRRFRIPPRVASQIDPVQQMTLQCVADALEDANLQVDKKSDGRAFDRERCAVILGNSLGGEIKDAYAIRLNWPNVAERLDKLPALSSLKGEEKERLTEELQEAYLEGLPPIDEDSMPGELSNVIAGRIANAFDLGGPNFTVDAACASSMASIQSAVKALQDGDCDYAISGGADRTMGIASYVKFCKIGALSPDHSSPFDQSANGFVMGEGCGILILKRYEDAVRDQDKIYALIRGIGASSDGRGKGITAPNIQGQLRALHRAYEDAGVSPGSVDLIEAHGTSTSVGDKVEIDALTEVLSQTDRGQGRPVKVGSVKSMIGHLKSAAGAASIIKTALALHHKTLPPSLGFKQAREDVALDRVPLEVQTHAEPWPEPEGATRRAGVSAFGFGGTNFHVVMEEYTGKSMPAHPTLTPPAPQPAPAASAPTAEGVQAPAAPPLVQPEEAPLFPEGVWATSALTREDLLRQLETLRSGGTAPWHPSAPIRIAAAARDEEDRNSQLDRAIKALKKGTNPDMLRARAIYLEESPADGKIAFLFTGQGSQYLNMGLDLAEAYPIVAETFAEADRILMPALGKPLTDFIRFSEGEDKDAKTEMLRQTEYSQPATLTLDIAILRLLAAYGVYPDLVAGHSLGEYGAAVASGVLSFENALHAVSARGREMAGIKLDDPGKMAGIAANAEVVDEVLAEIDGYVIAANKNCPTQTVIAGASDAVDDAAERFRTRGITVHPLPVSHAFHSSIVEPASEPLRKVLQRLGIDAPKRPTTTNVTGDYYPEGAGAGEAIIDILAQQISSPVEWISQLERMYDDNARIFVECGPKRALTGFTVSILKRREHRAYYTNHPKRGGVASFRDSLAGMLAAGLPVKHQPDSTDIDLFAPPSPRRATTEAIHAYAELAGKTEARPDVREGVLRIVAKMTGYEADQLRLEDELEADLGIDTVKQAEVFSVVRSTYGITPDPDFTFAQYRTLGSLIDWAADRLGARRVATTPTAASPITSAKDGAVADFLHRASQSGMQSVDANAFTEAVLPAVEDLLQVAYKAAQVQPTAPAPAPAQASQPATTGEPGPGSTRIVCTGASLGLPGGEEVFHVDNVASILLGENRISHIGDRAKEFLNLGLVRLVKDAETGAGSFLPVEELEQVIRLAGTKGHFDLEEWGINANLIRALDITTQLAVSAAMEALRDAGIPLVRSYKLSASGKKVPQGWALPEALREETGIVFASAFPGYDQFVQKMATNGDDGEGHFDRRILFQILAMGHSQLAQIIGAKGPNTQVNAACASTTQGLCIAADWLRTGRCRRVIVVGADDTTNENLLPWIGGGFMAAGAATTNDTVEEAALPFDKRRHGMIIGMGAVGLVLEDHETATRRGMNPCGELIGEAMVNSAFHGTRLDIEHISSTVAGLVNQACEKEGITPAQMAPTTLFMSHETYTPARGGSSAAEIAALRNAFGEQATEVRITNTKGFTGHPMGAGIEDAIAIKALQYGRVPPIANLSEPDPDLMPIRLSEGEDVRCRYALRLAAGFGSQLAVCLWKASAKDNERVANASIRAQWLREITGYSAVEEVVDQRTLRIVEAEGSDALYDFAGHDTTRKRLDDATGGQPVEAPLGKPAASPAPAPKPAPEAKAAPTAPKPTVNANSGEVLDMLRALIAEKTGYAVEEVEPDFELEADLGIDTVKQAEILSDLTEHYGLQRDDDFRLADYPTVEALAGYVATALGGAPGPAQAEPAPTPAPAEPTGATTPAPAPAAGGTGADTSAILAKLLALISDKTGYGEDELEPDFELEADLGIDTVKQAEILSDLTEHFGLQRDDDFRLADYPTIEALAGYVATALGGGGAPATASTESTPAAPAAPAQAPKPEPAAAETAPTPAAASEGDSATLPVLLELVAERTGYDVEELESDFELEADLGIDTVKQAEILSDLTDRFGLARDDEFKLADYPTLAALAGYIDVRRNADDAPSGQESAPTKGREQTPEVTPIAPLDLAPDRIDEPEVDEVERSPKSLPEVFRIRRPVPLPLPSLPESELGSLQVHLIGEGAFADALAIALTERGARLVEASDAAMILDAGEDILKAFSVAKGRADHPPERWVGVTRIGGLAEAQSHVDQAHAGGACAGLTKALAREWQRPCVAIDLHPSLEANAAAAALCKELTIVEAEEVFIDAEGARTGVAYRTEPSPDRSEGFSTEKPVILITGGGRGISACIAEEFASTGACRLALVGRTAAAEASLDEAKAKDAIRAQLKDAGERVTPAKIDQALKPMRKAAEVYETLERLKSMGSEVAYFTCDLADPAAIPVLMEQVADTFGPVNVLIHGAGVEESRQLKDKDESAFHRVFDGKAIGGLALLKCAPEDAWFLSMGSVAGRFGNPGQVDYSAANDAMARACIARGRALHVDWTAWDDVGMAVRGSMKRLLTERGVDMLPADSGAALVIDLYAAGAAGELVVAGRLGDFHPRAPHALLDRMELEGDRVRVRRSLSVASDPWIVDHAIDGTAVLPGVIGLEFMAAAAQLIRPDQDLSRVVDVQFQAPAKVHHDRVTEVIVEAEPEGDTGAKARLVSERELRTGRVQRTVHFEARFEARDEAGLEGLPSSFLPDETVESEAIYQRFFHGPKFQVLERTLGVAADALIAEASVLPEGIAPALRSTPLVLESAFQAAGIHRMIVEGSMALPQAIDCVERYGSPEPGKPFSITVQKRGDLYDIDVSGASGPLMRVRGFKMVEHGPLPPGDRFEAPEGGWPSIGTKETQAHAQTDDSPRAWLREDEITSLSQRGTPSRIADRLAGRIAAKKALSALTGVAPHEIDIPSAPSGEPLARVPGWPHVRVSLSHREGTAFAVAVREGRVGVDLEHIEPRPESFAQQWFSPQERHQAEGDASRLTLMWAIKEAVLKALGAGMALRPQDIEVDQICAGSAQVRLVGDARERHNLLGGGDLVVNWVRNDFNEVEVVVRMAA